MHGMLTMSSRCFASPRARDQLPQCAHTTTMQSASQPTMMGGVAAMSAMALTRCMLSSRTQEGATQAPCQRKLPRPTQRAKLPTHACTRTNGVRRNPQYQRCCLEQETSPSATSTKATLQGGLHGDHCQAQHRYIVRHSTEQSQTKPAHQWSPRAAARSPPPAGSRAAAPFARTVDTSGRLRCRARL
eukprot:SAG31_NODE_102_length_25175_cov_10.778553_21_plen_187_part_00